MRLSLENKSGYKVDKNRTETKRGYRRVMNKLKIKSFSVQHSFKENTLENWFLKVFYFESLKIAE